MARNRKDQSDPQVQLDWIKEGRGANRNGAYKPWLTIQDVPSRGLRMRLQSHITGDRLVHLLSSHEANAFFIYEAIPGIIDIREQFPLLPLEKTLKIAQELGVEHPNSPESGRPIVMSTDLLVTIMTDKGEMDFALSIKEVKELGSTRQRIKLEIARRYHELLGHQWGVLTERDIPISLAKNLEFLREYWDISSHKITSEMFLAIKTVLLPLISRNNESLSDAALRCDTQLGLSPTTSMAVAYHLMYLREWPIDLMQLLNPSRPICLLNNKTNLLQ